MDNNLGDTYMGVSGHDIGLKENMIIKKAYRVTEIISTSKLSIVYKGENLHTGENVAIKEFYPFEIAIRDLDDVTVINRLPSTKKKFEYLKGNFQNEGAILRQISHKNIIKYIDHFDENGTTYIISEYFKGNTLDKYIKEYSLDERSRLLENIFLSLVDALTSLHEKGIIHRDIKPSNIMVDSEKNIRLIDFGSALFYKTDNKKNIFTTPGFSPLEQYSNEAKQGVYTDIYSLGATLYYSLTDVTPLEVSRRLIEDQLIEVRKLNKEIGFIMSKVIMWSLVVQSSKRCFSMKFYLWAISIQKRTKRINSKKRE